MDNIQDISFDDIQKKLKELEVLKKRVEEIYTLNNIGDDVREELKVEQYKELKSNKVEIKHLDKKFQDKLYPKRKSRQPLLESEIKEALEKSTSALEAAKRLGVTYPTYRKWADKYGIHKTPGWPIKKGKNTRPKKGPISPFKGKYPIHEILEGKYPDFPVHRLKDKLIRSGIKKCECEQCGYCERRLTDGKIPLLLNFEDGNFKNHKLENIRLLCYNCTFTNGRGFLTKAPKYLKHFDPDMMQGSRKVRPQRF